MAGHRHPWAFWRHSPPGRQAYQASCLSPTFGRSEGAVIPAACEEEAAGSR